MKVQDYINNLIDIVKNNPEVGNYKCIYGSDDEGNSYHPVVYTPVLMKVESFNSHHLEVEDCEPAESNALCIN